MTPPRTLIRRLALIIVRYAGRVMPPDGTHSAWADAMRHEADCIGNDRAALRWALGCVRASYWQRIRALHIGTPASGSFRDVLKDAARYWEPRRITDEREHEKSLSAAIYRRVTGAPLVSMEKPPAR